MEWRGSIIRKCVGDNVLADGNIEPIPHSQITWWACVLDLVLGGSECCSMKGH